MNDTDKGAGFLLKAWSVTVTGYGEAQIVTSSRGNALANAWRSDVFNGISFKQFLSMASARRATPSDVNFGSPITVDGKPAFYVGRNRAYVQIALPGGDHVLSAHPSEIEPEHFRPAAYRATAPTSEESSHE